MSGRLSLFRDGTVHLASGDVVAMHATPAWKVVVALEAPMQVELDRKRGDARIFVVPPFVAQAIHTTGVTVAFFAEPGSPHAPFARGQQQAWQPTGKQHRQLLDLSRELAAGRPAEDPARTKEAFKLLALTPVPSDARVLKTLRLAASCPDLDLLTLAHMQQLSPVRLRHLVQAESGTALRTHKLWHRTLHAVEHLLGGVSIAAAALAAGFADHAHFSRSFARFTGRTPSSIHGDARVLSSYAARTQFINRASAPPKKNASIL